MNASEERSTTPAESPALALAKERGFLLASPADRELIEEWECNCDHEAKPRILVVRTPGEELACIDALLPIGVALIPAEQRGFMENLASAARPQPGRPRAVSYGTSGGYSDAIPADEAESVAECVRDLFAKCIRLHAAASPRSRRPTGDHRAGG